MHDYNTILGVIELRLSKVSYDTVQKRYRIGRSGITLIMKSYNDSGLSLDDLRQMPALYWSTDVSNLVTAHEITNKKYTTLTCCIDIHLVLFLNHLRPESKRYLVPCFLVLPVILSIAY